MRSVLVVGVAGIVFDIGVAETQAVTAAGTPVQLGFHAAQADAAVITGGNGVVEQRFADQAADMVIEQFDVQAQLPCFEVSVVTDFPRTHAFVIEVLRPLITDKVIGVRASVDVRRDIGDPIAPVRRAFEQVG